MANDIRGLLDEELSAEHPPPLGDLVRDAVNRGRRIRRRRRMFAGTGAAAGIVAVVAAAALVTGGLPGVGPNRQTPVAGATTVSGKASAPAELAPGRCPLPTDATPDPFADRPGHVPETDMACPLPREDYDLTVPDAPAAGKRVTGTPQGALELLTRVLPEDAEASGYAQGDGEGPGETYVQIYADRGKGPGMIRFSIYDSPKPTAEDTECKPDETCYDLPDGGQVTLFDNRGNCVDGTLVSLWRADGLSLTLRISGCLMWDGKKNPRSAEAVTVQEAITMILDPRWGTELPKEIVDAGADRFKRLPHMQGG
jgi:hypothetical protein